MGWLLEWVEGGKRGIKAAQEIRHLLSWKLTPQSLLWCANVEMQTDPVEGCFVEFVSQDNVFAWRVFIEGPSGTP